MNNHQDGVINDKEKKSESKLKNNWGIDARL
jgi:hypothetical protein